MYIEREDLYIYICVAIHAYIYLYVYIDTHIHTIEKIHTCVCILCVSPKSEMDLVDHIGHQLRNFRTHMPHLIEPYKN